MLLLKPLRCYSTVCFHTVCLIVICGGTETVQVTMLITLESSPHALVAISNGLLTGKVAPAKSFGS